MLKSIVTTLMLLLTLIALMFAASHYKAKAEVYKICNDSLKAKDARMAALVKKTMEDEHNRTEPEYYGVVTYAGIDGYTEIRLVNKEIKKQLSIQDSENTIHINVPYLMYEVGDKINLVRQK